MNAISEIVAEEINWHAIAREALEQADRDMLAARELLVAKVYSDPGLLQAITQPAITDYLYRVIQNVCNSERRSAMDVTHQKGSMARAVDGSVFRQAVSDNFSRLMDMPIWAGKRLGDCTSDELYESADKYDARARTYTKQASFQAAVAALLEKNGEPGDIVRNCLSENTLTKLWEEVDGN